MGGNFSEENDVASIFAADASSAPSYEVVKATAASLPKERPAEIETVKTVKLRYGDTFGEVLKKAGVKPEQIERGMVALSKVFNPSRVKAGREVNMEVKNGDLISLSLKPRPGRSVGLKREADGSFRHWVKQAEGRDPHPPRLPLPSALIWLQVSQAVGVPSAVLAEAVSAFSYEIDFQRDIHPHNRFDFLYEVTRDEHSGEVMSSRLLRASIGYRDKSMLVYRYEGAEDGNRNVFYHEDGSSVVRSLLPHSGKMPCVFLPASVSGETRFWATPECIGEWILRPRRVPPYTRRAGEWWSAPAGTATTVVMFVSVIAEAIPPPMPTSASSPRG